MTIAEEVRRKREREHAGRNGRAKKDPSPTQAEVLLKLAGAATYVHTADGKAYALVPAGEGGSRHVETLGVRTRAFRSWLARELYRSTGKAASAKTTQEVLGVLEARASYDGAERAVSLRVAEAGGALHLDLADAGWRSVAVTRDGWAVGTVGTVGTLGCEIIPPLFRRPRGMMPLPEPAPGGDLGELRKFVNVADEDWTLVVPWLVQALRPRGPYPVLCLYGEQGAAKSTTAKVLRSLIDPNAAPLRSQPRDERDLVIAASNSWVVALDNLSHLEPWVSDALCRLSTGGGFGTRELYSDDEEVIFDAQRPIIINGIEDLASRGDLLDRSLLLRLPRIEDGGRRTEESFWREFEAARPRLLGALLDAASGALARQPRVRLARLPRMADFGVLGVAVERALGWKKDSFLGAYAGNRDDAAVAALESSLIYPALENFITTRQARKWEGQCQDLLEELTRYAGDRSRSRYWPTSARGLSGQLRRLAPSLRKVGIFVTFDQTGGSNSKKIVRVRKIEGEQSGEQPTQPTPPTQATHGGPGGSVGGVGCVGTTGNDSPDAAFAGLPTPPPDAAEF
jgi:hypothetical protein